VTTALFTLACWTIVISTIIRSPVQSAIGLVIVLSGVLAYRFWRAPLAARTP
jgi:hypothetical protein